jgi:hypothetical protein
MNEFLAIVPFLLEYFLVKPELLHLLLQPVGHPIAVAVPIIVPASYIVTVSHELYLKTVLVFCQPNLDCAINVKLDIPSRIPQSF